MPLSDEAQQRNNTDALVRSFKKTGLAPPVEAWQPKPTAGDAVREVIGEIGNERDAAIGDGDKSSQQLWRG